MPAHPELPWSALVDQFPEPLILAEASGRVVFANREARRVFGYGDDAMTGIAVETLIPPDFRANHLEHRRAYLEHPTVRDMRARGVPIYGLRRDGTRFQADVRLAPIETSDGLLIAATVHDATEHQLIADTLTAARDTANQANLGKSRFLAAVSHDLRQPLQTLRLLNTAMQRRAVAPDIEHILREEARALDAISALVGKVLNVSKLESGTVEPKFDAVPIAALLDDVRGDFAAAAREKHLAFEVRSCGEHVRTDRTLLRQMLDNLVANAIRYTDAGHVRLSARSSYDRVSVAVEDSGLGIPTADLPHIFEDFCQVDRPGRKTRGGLGLGLGTVRRIAALLQVDVQVNSQVAVGTRFHFDLPVTIAPAKTTGSPPVRTEFVGQRVFLIEDDVAVREALTLLLKLEGFSVEAAGDLAEVAARLATMTEPPTVLISDFQLRGLELGTDGIRLVRDRFNVAIPTVILTGDTSAAALDLVDLSHMVVLNKPVSAEELTDAIGRVCMI
jgi:PAS domain S-box-containing protein